MTIKFNPPSCVFPDTAVGSTSYRKIACYQPYLMTSEHDISVDVAKPFTSKPYNESAYGKSVSDNVRMLRNYVSKQYADAANYRIVDVLDSTNNIFNTVNQSGLNLKLYKTSKSSFAETETTLCEKGTDTVFYSRGGAGKHMVYDSTGNYILCAYMYENDSGHNFEVKKIDPDDLSVVDTYTDTHADYEFDINDIILGENDILYIVGFDGTDGKLMAFDLNSFTISQLIDIAGYVAYSISAKYANGTQYVFAGCSGLIHTYSWTSGEGFVLESQSIPNPGENIPVAMPRDFGLIKNNQYAVVADEINKFTPSHCLKSESATPLYILMGNKTYTISDFIFSARFIPTTDDQNKIIYTDDGRETFRIYISSANVLTVDIRPAGIWRNMATSVALPIVANDTIDMYLARQHNVWLLSINGKVYTMTNGAEYDTDISFETGFETAQVFNDATGDFFVRSMKLELATEVLFDFVFNYSSTGKHVSNGHAMSVSNVAYSQPTASFALFREYSDRIKLAERRVAGALYFNNTMYLIRDRATRTNSITRIDLISKKILKNSGNLISDSPLWTSVAEFTRNMAVSVLDSTLYFCTSIQYGSYDTLVYTGKTNLNLSYESNAKYCELAFAPTAAGVFSDNLVINTVDSLPILGIGFTQETRVVPYSTIMIDNCGDDYMRYNYSNPSYYTVFKYKRFSEWDAAPEPSQRYVYNSNTGTFTQNALGTFQKVADNISIQGVQDLGSQFDAYFDTVNFYYDISQAHLIKNNPVGFFLVSAVSMMANEITYTLDSNYRFNTDKEVKLNGRKEETSLFSDAQLCYALGSKQIEVNEITAINSRDHRCIKFRIKMRRSNPEIASKYSEYVYDDWRIFEIKYTPSDLFYVEGE